MRRLLVAALAALVFAAPGGAAQAQLPVGSTPPDALGKSLADNAVSVSQFRGRVVVVTFWASWCGPCRRELPALDALKQAAGDRAEIVAVNVKDGVREYHAITNQLQGTKLIFTHDSYGSIAEGYGVDAYPNLFVIDQAGRVANVHVGYGEGALERIVAEINALLAHPAVAQN